MLANQFIYINRLLKGSNSIDAFPHLSTAGGLPFLLIIVHSLFVREACLLCLCPFAVEKESLCFKLMENLHKEQGT